MPTEIIFRIAKNKPFFLVALFLFFHTAHPASAIIGGMLSNDYENYSVMLVSKSGGMCSGIVIAPDIVITAAQCIDKDIDEYKIYLRDKNNKSNFVDIENIVKHPDYVIDAAKTRQRSIDLAIIKTKKDGLKDYSYMNLPEKDFQIYKTGTILELIGFGLSSETDKNSAGKLRLKKLPIVTPYGQGRILLWLQGEDSGACFGDAGGGIIGPNKLLIAITAWSEGILPKKCGHLTQGIMLAPFRNWIDDTINNLSPKSVTTKIVIPPVIVSPALTSKSKPVLGTAFRIANGQFVTNYNVIEECTTIKVGGLQGGRVLASDAFNDLALISLQNDSGDIASIRTTRTQLNEMVTVAGYSLEGALTSIELTNGTVSSLSGLKGDTGQLQISATIQYGNSGGPLLDTAGNVIGVVSGMLSSIKISGASGDISQNLNYAIGGIALRAFLDANGVYYKGVGRESDIRGEQIAQRANGFTVLVECR